jgi:hypothetical protein
MKRKNIFAFVFCVFAFCAAAHAQPEGKKYFSASSSSDAGSKEYGVINLKAEKQTMIINTIMAYGENVKGLSIQINNGFPFRLAPSQGGQALNYVGSNLSIVLQPGDKAKIEFAVPAKGMAVRNLYVSGETVE